MAATTRRVGSGTHYVPGMTEDQAREAARLEVPVLIAVLLTIPTLVLSNVNVGDTLDLVADVLNWVIWLTFLVEFVIMLRIAPDNREWAKHNVLDIAVLVLTPPFLPEVLHALWVLRLLRIVDLMPVMGRIFGFNQFRYAATLAFLAILGGGVAFVNLENDARVAAGNDPANLFDGLWWAMTTISTVGYGDFFPTSTAGRIVGMSLMVLGPVLIGLVASGVGAAITQEIKRDLEEIGGELADDVVDLQEDLDEVEADVEQLTATDRRVLAKLDEISNRLGELEKRR